MHNLRSFLILLFLFTCLQVVAQETVVIEGDTLELRQEVEGPLELFWTEKANNYRYFIRKGERFAELKNEPVSGSEKREYQLQLENFTRDAVIYANNVKFAIYSLRHYVNRYNAKVQENYEFNAATPDIQKRVGMFVGMSNNRYTRNPENTMVPVLGFEYELYDPNLASRHSGFLQLRQSFRREEYKYISTQLSLNYRFKVVYFTGFDVHIDTELATFYYSEDKRNVTNNEGEVIRVVEEQGFSFTAPLSFGLGADIKINRKSFITVGYNDIVAIVLESNGSFPIDITVGFKYNL